MNYSISPFFNTVQSNISYKGREKQVALVIFYGSNGGGIVGSLYNLHDLFLSLYEIHANACFIYISVIGFHVGNVKLGKCVLRLMRSYGKCEMREIKTRHNNSQSDSLIIVWFVHKSFLVVEFVCG